MSLFFIGGIAALLSAASWALGAVLWRRIGEEISPFSMNLGKGIIGCLYLGIVLVVIGIEPVDLDSFLLLGISGFLGITLGDTFFFMSLMHMGPRLASLMGTLTPVFIAISAVIFLNESPSVMVWSGIVLTVGGVVWVLQERLPRDKIIKNKSLGIQLGLLSVLFTTAGIILAKIGVASVPTVQATFIRLICGVVGLVMWGMVNRQLKYWMIPFHNLQLLKSVAIVVFLIVFGGCWLSLFALKYIDASIAGTLGSIGPLFMLPMAALLLKERISSRAVLGAVITVSGIALIFINR